MNANDLGQTIARFESGYSVQLTWALVHFLWQGCAIAVLYVAVTRGLRRTQANTRYVVGVAALLGMAACLPITLWLLPPPPMQASMATLSPSVRTFFPPASPAVSVVHTTPSLASCDVSPGMSAVDYASTALVKSSPYSVATYLTGVGLMLVRIAFGFWAGRRLHRKYEPMADGAMVEMFRRNARRMGVRVVPAVAYCRRICVPVVVGVLRPMILLPTSLASGLTLTQLEAVLLHELAHIRRFDLIVNVLQRLIEALLFFHPAVWWVSHRISLEREIACDDIVLHLNHERAQYADALLRVAELCAIGKNERAALAATGCNVSQFQRRVLRLLGIDEKPGVRLTTFGVLMSLLMIASLMFALMVWRDTANAQVDSQTGSKANENTAPAASRRPALAKAATKPSQEMVADVRITGNKSLPVDDILTHIQTRSGRPFDLELIDEDVRRLDQTHLFVNVRTYSQQAPGGRIVIFDVLERSLLQDVLFIGGSEMRKKVLQKEAGLKKGSPVDPFAIEEARRKLEEFYHKKRFSAARITLLEGDNPKNRRAVFLVNEGTKQKLWKVSFVGNTIASDERLNTQIKSNPPVLKFVDGEVVRKLLDEDVERLTTYYRGLGFFRVRIGRELEFNEREGWVTATFVIDEGSRYKIRNVSVVGNTKFTSNELLAELKLKNGDYFNNSKMRGDCSALQDKYGGIGYVLTNVKADLRFLEEAGPCDLVYHIKEGDRYRIRRLSAM